MQIEKPLLGGRTGARAGSEAGVGSEWEGRPLEEEEAWKVGEVTGQGLSSGTPAVRTAEATGPTVAAEGHWEGNHGVHTRRAAREPDGGEAQLTVGAYWLGHRRQGSWQYPNLEAGCGQQ